MAQNLKLVIEPKSASSRTLLADFIDQLESLTRLLKALSDDLTSLEVVSLSKNSPLVAELRSVQRTKVLTKKNPQPTWRYRQAPKPIHRVARTLEALTTDKKLPNYVDPFVLSQLRDFADGLEKSDSVAKVSVDNETYNVDTRLKKVIDSRLGGVRIAVTSFTGKMESLNVHGSRWAFTIYPIAGPNRIRCFFDKDDLDKVKGLVKEVVTVRGRAIYRESSPWPLQIKVDSVQRREPASEGEWASIPETMAKHWSEADADERELLELEAEGA